MAEIKSTMDIIMEKARALEPSEEEKRVFRRQALEETARGLVQKVLDGLLSSKKVRETLEDVPPERRAESREALIRACLERLDPGRDNQVLYDLLTEAAGVDPAPVRELVDASRSRLSDQAEDRREVLLERLRERGVSGTAVEVNLRADPEWRRLAEQERESLRRALEHTAAEIG